ncbi:hypothetical protein [Cellulomonas sp. NPDC089187]|uniref:hypothetical protein n=1 Tax=Cellulomonas sp. NPDC089187 TaxID=3154970 RepID=UPI00341AE95A
MPAAKATAPDEAATEVAEPDEVEVFGWVTLEEVERHWTTALDLDPEDLALHLNSAHQQCVAFLNDREPDPVLDRHKLAQIMQARALYRSLAAGSGDQLGGEDGVTVFPMDWTVKNLLRPKRARRYLR